MAVQVLNIQANVAEKVMSREKRRPTALADKNNRERKRVTNSTNL